MIVTIAKTDLSRAVARCAAVADKRSAMPMLACVLVEVGGPADEPRAWLSATDLFVSVRVETACESDATGSFAVDAKDLGDRLKHMPDGKMRMTYADGRCVLSAVGSPRKFTMFAHDGKDFPAVNVAAEEGAAALTIPADRLASAIGRIIYAVSLDETRAHVNSGLFVWGAGKLTIVATDGHRLSKVEVEAERGEKIEALVPLRALHELRRLCADGGDVALRVSGTAVYVDTTAALFSAKLVDAQFPPYAQVIPKANAKRRVTIGRAAAVSAIEAIAVTAKDATGGMMKMSLAEGSVRFSAESGKSGDAFDDVPADCAITQTIGMNGRYLLDVLGAVDEDEVQFEVGGELDPVRIDSAGLVAVVMPARV